MKDNPFSPGGIVKSTLFGGRHEYILSILRRLTSVKSGKPSSFYLYGERGIGKTALAKLINYIVSINDKDFNELNFLTSYYSAQRSQSFRNVLEASLNNLADQIEESTLKKIGARLGKIFNNGKFSIGAFGFEAGYEYKDHRSNSKEGFIIKDQVVSILRNILNQIKNDLNSPDCKDGIFIIIDEMDNISDVEIAASITRGITTELDFEDLGFISFMFIGYQNSFEAFTSGDESIKRLLDPIHLTEMPENEVIETFEKGFKAVNVKWDKELLKSKAWLTGGYPLAIQVIGYHLIENDTDNYIDEKDWDFSINKSAEELIDREFSSYYSFGTHQKLNKDKILLALAIASIGGCDSLSLKEIEELSDVKNPSQYLKQLMKSGVVFRDVSSKEYIIKKGLLRTSIVLDLIKSYSDEEGHQIFQNQLAKAKRIYKTKLGNSAIEIS